jgi:hypothetical protein
MSFRLKPECHGEREEIMGEARCPACGVDLNAGATPLHSIVICARCCAALLWDGTFSVATTEQLERLSERDRRRLDTLVAAQRARNGSPLPN